MSITNIERRYLPARAFFVAGLVLAPALFAQTPPSSPSPSPYSDQSNEVVQLSGFTVHGYQESLNASLEAKRASKSIIDVITAEDLGKFSADTNVAESLAHLPGITVDRLWGQGEKVSINGTDPDLNLTFLNGEPIASGVWYTLDQPNRGFNYTLLAPEAIGKAEVYKTSEAWLPEGSLGGTVILNTRKGLDLPANSVAGSVGYNYNDLSKQGKPQASALYSWKNNAKTVGLVVSVQQADAHIRRDGIEGYNISSPAQDAQASGGIAQAAQDPAIVQLLANNPNAQYPTQIGTNYFEQERKRFGFQAGLQFKPVDKLEIEYNLLWVKADFKNLSNSMYIEPSLADGTDTLTSATISNGVISQAHFDQGVSLMDVIYDPDSETKTTVNDFKISWRDENWGLSTHFGWTSANGGSQREVFTEANYQGGYSYDLSKGPYITWDDPAAVKTPADWSFLLYPDFQGQETRTVNTARDGYGQLDFDLKVDSDFIHKLQTGIRYTDHTTSEDATSVAGLGDNPLFPANYASFVTYMTPANFLRGINGISAAQQSHYLVDVNSVTNFFNSLPAASYPFTKQPSDYGQTWSVNEKVSAGYVQADYGYGKITGNVGVRYVTTKQKSLGYLVDAAGNVTPTVANIKYNNVLPSLNTVYGLTDNLSLRFGAAAVIARQNYSDLTTGLSLQDPLPGGIGSGTGGNPNLKPYKSTNLDLSIEWYLSKNSLLQLSFFDRLISNYKKQQNFLELHNSDALGATFYSVTRPINGGSATSKGWDLAYQQAFGHGFGATANFTLTDSRGNDGVALPYASKNSFNLSPYYENGRWSAHLTYSWRSDYIYLSSINNLNDYVHTDAQLEASLGYHFTKNLWISLDGTNLLDAIYQQYLKTPGKFIVSEYKVGRGAEASLHFNF
ncbi:MAG TPA: TonB-dependent receptor [Opitutaceae bacterium]|jgi:iron complex outermembrane receptor protein|nr:TonB-dependent receptor [Opitutaceae bacterium]